MSRRSRRSRRRGLLPAGPRWTMLARGVRRQARAGARTARKRRNELAITLLYAIAGALCLALAALLVVPSPTPAVQAATRLPESAPPAVRATVIGAVVLACAGVFLFGLAANSLRLWWQNRT